VENLAISVEFINIEFDKTKLCKIEKKPYNGYACPIRLVRTNVDGDTIFPVSIGN